MEQYDETHISIKNEINRINILLLMDKTHFDNNDLDLRSNLESELLRGTINGLKNAIIGKYIIYYSSSFGIFYHKDTKDFLFMKGDF